jgi:diaminohydroxyphosphoribosylaminopyrimidine deaminase / 5-amino-6-(5-phosphoribosylamino)uracil reductase
VDQLGGYISLACLMRELGKQGMTSILIEGGSRIAASALAEGVVDKVMAFVAPKIVGGASARTPVEGPGVERIANALTLDRMKVRAVGCDILIEAYTCSPD